MGLTKEDLEAIGGIVKEEIKPIKEEITLIKEDVSSLQRAFKQFVHAQVKLVDNLEQMDGNIKLLISHVGLSSDNRNLRKIFQDIERDLTIS